MGTSGTGPFDSDAAADWWMGNVEMTLCRAMVETIRKRGLYGQRDYQPGRVAIRSALMLCADGQDRLQGQTLETAKQMLEQALGDETFLRQWTKRAAILAELREELLAVEAALGRVEKRECDMLTMIRGAGNDADEDDLGPGLRVIPGGKKVH